MPQLNGPITPMEDAFPVSRDAGNPPVRFDVSGAGDGLMEPQNGHEAGYGGNSQGAFCTPPRRSPKAPRRATGSTMARFWQVRGVGRPRMADNLTRDSEKELSCISSGH